MKLKSLTHGGLDSEICSKSKWRNPIHFWNDVFGNFSKQFKMRLCGVCVCVCVCVTSTCILKFKKMPVCTPYNIRISVWECYYRCDIWKLDRLCHWQTGNRQGIFFLIIPGYRASFWIVLGNFQRCRFRNEFSTLILSIFQNPDPHGLMILISIDNSDLILF